MQRKTERRNVLIAIAVSLLLHLAVAFSLAAFGGVFTPPAPEEEKVPEITLIDLPPEPPPRAPVPLVQKNPTFMPTDDTKKAASPPPEKTFESNANSIAASRSSASGDSLLPSQDGKQRPFVNLETQQLALAAQGSTPQPKTETTPSKILEPMERPTATPPPKPSATPRPKPVSTPKPAPVASPKPTRPPPPEPDQLAMLTSTPPPALRPSEMPLPSAIPELATPTPTPPAPARPKPDHASSSYQPQKEETRITGRITSRGPSAVNAVETPMGRYKKTVSDAIGSRWYYYTAAHIDLLSIGTAHVEAQISPRGKVESLRVISNNSNEAFANICLQSFQEAQIPPIPEELIATLPGGRMPVDIYFTTYSNE